MRHRAPSLQTRAILAALLHRPIEWCHGYELTKLVALSSGTLYPILIRLHDKGLLESKWTEPERPGLPARHAYRLSANGLAYARELTWQAAAAPKGSPEVPA